MRIVLASQDPEAAEWLAHVLGAAGLSVAVLADASPASAELRDADLLIADAASAAALGEAGPERRMLLSPRGGTVDLAVIQGHFSDVLAVPGDPDEVVARVRHAVSK